MHKLTSLDDFVTEDYLPGRDGGELLDVERSSGSAS
jgi:hypothetical protein